MQITSRLLLCLAAALFLNSAQAAVSPVSVSVVPPVQFPPSDYNIAGARISALYGNHRDVRGIDIGVLGNITQQTFTGLAVSGLFNLTKGQTTILGAQIAGITNINRQKTNVFGLQLAGALNYQDAESSVTGLQAAVLGNVAPHTTVYGFQVGLYNRAKSVYGFQIGLVNDTVNLHGIQIGLVNFHRTGLFYVSPIINVGF